MFDEVEKLFVNHYETKVKLDDNLLDKFEKALEEMTTFESQLGISKGQAFSKVEEEVATRTRSPETLISGHLDVLRQQFVRMASSEGTIKYKAWFAKEAGEGDIGNLEVKLESLCDVAPRRGQRTCNPSVTVVVCSHKRSNIRTRPTTYIL